LDCKRNVAALRNRNAIRYYANSNNQFWNTLYKVGLTPYRLQSSEDHSLLNYSVGLSDLIKDQHGNDNLIQFNTMQINEFNPANEPDVERYVCAEFRKAIGFVFGGQVKKAHFSV